MALLLSFGVFSKSICKTDSLEIKQMLKNISLVSNFDEQSESIDGLKLLDAQKISKRSSYFKDYLMMVNDEYIEQFMTINPLTQSELVKVNSISITQIVGSEDLADIAIISYKNKRHIVANFISISGDYVARCF